MESMCDIFHWMQLKEWMNHFSKTIENTFKLLELLYKIFLQTLLALLSSKFIREGNDQRTILFTI